MMKIPTLLLTLSLTTLLPVGSRAQAPSSDRFDRTKQRVDALLQQRRTPDVLPAKLANPFSYIVPGIVSPIPVVTNPLPTSSKFGDDTQILAYCVSRFRLGGEVLLGGTLHLQINSATYKEGDLIPVPGNGDTVYYIKVVKINRADIVFGYNDAVLTLPYKF